MRFFCGNCLAKYKVADEKLKDKIFRFRCRRCEAVIAIDNFAVSTTPKVHPEHRIHSALEAEFWASFPKPRTMPGDLRLYAAVKPPGIVPKNTESAHYWTVAVDTAPWFILSHREPKGPFSAKQLSSDFEYGLIEDDTLVWKNGLPGWVPIANAKALIALVSMLSDIAGHKTEEESHHKMAGPPKRQIQTKEAETQDAKEPETDNPQDESVEDSSIDDILIEQDEGKMIQAFEQMQGIYATKQHDEAASFALDLAQKIVPCSAGLCLLLAPGSHRYYIASATAIDPLPQGKNYSPDKGLLSQVTKTRKVIHIVDAASDERFDPKTDQIGKNAIKNLLCAPIQHLGHIFGILQLVNSENGFDEDDVDVLNYIAHALAEYIEVSLPERDGFREEDFSSS